MVCIHLRFPLGMFYALTDRDRSGPAAEWAPSPVRLIGALLAAAHEIPSDNIEADRAVLRRLCTARPPTVHSPRAVPQGEQLRDAAKAGAVAELRGASRWAPRNPGPSELKDISPRVIGRSRTEVDKNGIAIGEHPVAIAWPDLDLTDEETRRLRRMASNVAWLGTSRSPVIATVDDRLKLGAFAESTPEWSPLPWDTVLADAQVRVPTPDLLDRFDAAYETRRSTKGRVESSGQQRPTAGGNLWPYAIDDHALVETVDPRYWGRFAVVVLDDDSQMSPRTASTYLIARAFRAALLDTFDDRGADNEAPGVLHGHREVPHIAIVPLPSVGQQYADGSVRGFGLIFPHSSRLPDVAEQEQAVEVALREFFPEAGNRCRIKVPGAGSLFVRPLAVSGDRLWALSPARYMGPSRVWVTVTPVVHSRWQKGNGVEALAAQVAADCIHVGLPEPSHIEVLRASAVAGGANRLVPLGKTPEEWRKPLQGPTSHLRLEFEQEIQGPVLLGRARHFGVGLCVPESEG